MWLASKPLWSIQLCFGPTGMTLAGTLGSLYNRWMSAVVEWGWRRWEATYLPLVVTMERHTSARQRCTTPRATLGRWLPPWKPAGRVPVWWTSPPLHLVPPDSIPLPEFPVLMNPSALSEFIISLPFLSKLCQISSWTLLCIFFHFIPSLIYYKLSLLLMQPLAAGVAIHSSFTDYRTISFMTCYLRKNHLNNILWLPSSCLFKVIVCKLQGKDTSILSSPLCLYNVTFDRSVVCKLYIMYICKIYK